MKYIFDSSAIYNAIKQNKIENLAGNYTQELARYELGNSIWKDHFLQAKISEQTQRPHQNSQPNPKHNDHRSTSWKRRRNTQNSNPDKNHLLRRLIHISCKNKRPANSNRRFTPHKKDTTCDKSFNPIRN